MAQFAPFSAALFALCWACVGCDGGRFHATETGQGADAGAQPPSHSWTTIWDSGGSDFARQVAAFADDQIYLAGFSDGTFTAAPAHGAWDAFAIRSDGDAGEVWRQQWGTESPEFAQSIAVDGEGNVFVAGYTYGALAEANAGKYDAFLIKLGAAGDTQWVRQWGTPEHDYVYGLAVTLGGDAFVVGYTEGDLAATNAGEADAFLAAFNAAGESLFVRQWGTAATDYAQAVATDHVGNIWVTGYSQGELDSNVKVGSEDAFLTRFDVNGNKQWTRQWGSTMTDYGLGVVADGAGNAFVTGYTYGSVEAEAWQGGQDAFLSGFTAEGTALFNRQWGTSFDDNARSLTLAGSLLIVTGDTEGALTPALPNGGRDAFLAAYDTTGSAAWTVQWGGAGNDFALGVTAADSATLFVGGYGELADGSSSGTGPLRDAQLSKWSIE
jgi:hypothetical protein